MSTGPGGGRDLTLTVETAEIAAHEVMGNPGDRPVVAGAGRDPDEDEGGTG